MRSERGFTLVEILVSVAIFAVIVIGAIGVLGAADVGGFLEGFPIGVVTTRVARDTTAASVYLQKFQEYAATWDDAGLLEGDYCEGPGCGVDPDCTGAPLTTSGLTGYPTPPTLDYQLDWRCLEVTIDRWYWDDDIDSDGPGPDLGKVYCDPDTDVDLFLPWTTSEYDEAPCSADLVAGYVDTTLEYLTQFRSTLTWRLRDVTRTLRMERFLP